MSAQETTERSGRERPTQVGTCFVGRASEFAALTSALAHPPALVLIEGEAGIGKTRLLQEYLASHPAPGHRALVACCPPLRQPQTLGPVADAIRQSTDSVRGLRLSTLAGALRPLFPEWALDLPPAPEPAEDATAARHRLFRALRELLGCLRVALLVAEDVHWADEATLEFLLFLASRQQHQMSLVVTCRPEDVPEVSLLPRLTSRLAAGIRGYRITIGPLDVAATAGLMSSMLHGVHVSDEFAAFLHQHTEGVPLAVEESMQLMVSRAEVFRRGDGWVRRSLAAIQVPPTIRDAVLERAQWLSPDAHLVLRAAAVLTEPTDETTIRAVAGMTAARARAGLSTALGCGLLAEGERGLLRFRHALACQAVYEAIPGPERRILHRRVAHLLERVGPPPVARLAHHFGAAGDTANWCKYGEQAADLALASGDEAAASVLLQDLITNASLPTKVVARLAAKLPLSALLEGARFQALLGALNSLLATRVLTPQEEADIRVQLGQALTHIQEWAAGRAELERAIPHLEHDPAVRARAMMLLAWPRGDTCRADEHIGWLRRAATLAAPMKPADSLRLAVDRVSALLMLGEEEGWTEASRLPRDVPTGKERLEITRSHLNIGDEALRWGRYREAAWRLERAQDLARSHQCWRLHDNALATRMHLDWFTGSWDGLAERAATLASDDDVLFVTRLEGALVAGLLDAAVGARSQADKRLRAVLREIEQRAEMGCSMEPAAALARLWLAEGRTGDALDVTDGPIGIVAGKGTWVWATDLAPARVAGLAAARRTDEAGELVSAFARGLGARAAPAPQAGLIMCRAILDQARADYARAAALFSSAAAAWQALPRPYDALLARERQADCLLAAGRTDEGLSLATEVLRGLSDLGARGDGVRVMRTLRHHGLEVKRPWWGGRRGYGDQLSPREIEVARLLVEGQTNREIARALSLSPRTVDRHLYGAMRKLNVSSRSALAARVVAAGIVSGDRVGAG